MICLQHFFQYGLFSKRGKPTHFEIREFTALVPDMVALRDWIVSQNCHHAAMESIGIYWMPIYEILEDAFSGGITLLVVNARHMKNVPGRKTDMRDSEWISALLRAEPLNGSFIPEKKIREFRDLNRYRKSVIRDTYLSSWYWRIRQKKGVKKPLLPLPVIISDFLYYQYFTDSSRFYDCLIVILS